MKTTLVTLVLFAGMLLAAQANASSDTGCGEGQSESQCAALLALADLRGTVDDLVVDGALAHSLDVKIDAATSSVLALRITPALNELDAFGNEVSAAEKSGGLFSAISNILKNKHDTVKNTIQNVR
jgi:hypothetical protein